MGLVIVVFGSGMVIFCCWNVFVIGVLLVVVLIVVVSWGLVVVIVLLLGSVMVVGVCGGDFDLFSLVFLLVFFWLLV